MKTTPPTTPPAMAPVFGPPSSFFDSPEDAVSSSMHIALAHWSHDGMVKEQTWPVGQGSHEGLTSSQGTHPSCLGTRRATENSCQHKYGTEGALGTSVRIVDCQHTAVQFLH